MPRTVAGSQPSTSIFTNRAPEIPSSNRRASTVTAATGSETAPSAGVATWPQGPRDQKSTVPGVSPTGR